MNSTGEIVRSLGKAAKAASAALAQASEKQLDKLLDDIAKSLRTQESAILEANAKDVATAKQKNMTPALIDRLTLNQKRIEGMIEGVEVVRALPDPVGKVLWSTTRPNGMKIDRVAVPIGVLGMIYESRPNVTVDAAALCL